MLLTKEVEIKLNPRNIEHYKLLGYKIPMRRSLKNDKKYVYNCDESIVVRVEDLLRGSKSKVIVQCDYCGIKKWICYRNYLDSIEKYGLYSCNKCLYHKSEKTNFSKYGTYHYSTTLECKEKIKNTCLSYYGTNCASKNEEIKKKTCMTNIKRYGVPYTQQSPEVKEKANETLCKNGTQKTSKQQLYLHSLYGGKLNYPISYYAADICFPEEKLVIEYDGGGHDLRVTLGRLTQEEFNQKEIIRDNIIKREGYKIITIISNNDKLPSDQVLLQMLQDARSYFSNYPQHSWCEYNISTSTVRNAEHKEGIPYNYGELRAIKNIA